MPLCRVNFPCLLEQRKGLQDAVNSWLISLERNGQILPGVVLGWTREGLLANCVLPTLNSLSFPSPYVENSFKIIRSFCEPEIHVEPDPEMEYIDSLNTVAKLILCGNESLPLRCNKGLGVPLYLLPWHADDREKLFCWALEFARVSDLEASCGSLEWEAYREMADLWSSLTRRGRAWADYIEKTVNIPTYYYLVRHYGNEGEQTQCPCCGRPRTRIEGEEPFGNTLQCDADRLISGSPSDTSGDWRAKWGTWERRPGSGYPPS